MKIQIQLISTIDEKPVINESSTVASITSIGVDLREYNADDINEAHIVNTVKLTSDEDSEFQDVFSIFEL
ncbi:8596_t:CDS:2 [Rhizophagus irregularis]|nr:8596_t:CDS:2 [Rhizophagus irregularis]